MYLLRTFSPLFHCICMYVVLLMSGLRLSDLNKETTYLLTTRSVKDAIVLYCPQLDVTRRLL